VAAPCSSVFFSLPKLVVGGTPHLAAFSDASPQANAAWALAYCQQRNASFGAAGTVRRGVLPPGMAAHAAAVLTFSPADSSTCIGRDCPFVAVVECVPAGAAPCAADEHGNVGVGNTGWHNVGHYNAGSHNLGSRNSGDGNMGDMNAASNCMGSYNTADGSFGFGGSGVLVPSALRR
jgi:hypothetical protein